MKIMTVALAGIAAACPAAALAGDAAVEAPIRQFVSSFDKGDSAGAAATMADSLLIIDEIAPFRWQGAGAFSAWAAALDSDAKAKGIADQKVTLGEPTRELVAPGHAYVVVPATYMFTRKGVAMAEVAQMTFTLDKAAQSWKISGWTWTGPDPSPAR